MRRIIVTASLATIVLMIVSSTWAGTFVENFDDGNFDGWEIYGGGIAGAEWRIENGVAIGKAARDWNTGLIFGEDDWRNYSIECDVKMVQKLTDLPSVGLGLRTTDNDVVWCFYSVIWESALIWTWINNNGAKQSDLKAFDLELDRWYRFKAVADEDDFEFYIDGDLMATLSDPRLSTGGSYINVAGSVAHFDNVVITGDDVPDNASSAVSSSGKLAASWGQLRSR
jgi:hypothetical protein